jgi:hypothetical protein
MIVPFSFRYDFSVQLVDSYDRKDCDTLVAEPPTEADSQSSPNATEQPITECSFPQTDRTPPDPWENGEWIYSCLSAGENNWVGQDESWKAENWKRGSGQSEIVNIVIPEGAVTMGIGCDPCTILKANGSTISSTGGNFGSFQPNIQFEVSPGELYKARIFGADSCPTRSSVIPPCAPEIYIWFNLPSQQIGSACNFIDELLTKANVIQELYDDGQSLAGVQVQLLNSIDVPIGWVVHKDGQEYTGPVSFEANITASFWSPVSCRPLRTNG